MAMSEEYRAELERKGAVVTTVQEWLGLDDIEMHVIELRVAMAIEVKRRRLAAGLSPRALAHRMKVPQSQIPDIEAGISPSLEAIMAAFFATGGTFADLASVVGPITLQPKIGQTKPAATRKPRRASKVGQASE